MLWTQAIAFKSLACCLTLFMLQVDDLLQSHGLAIRGEKAIAALNVKHTGLQLYPVHSDQPEQFHSLQTAAAFVSSRLLASDDEAVSKW